MVKISFWCEPKTYLVSATHWKTDWVYFVIDKSIPFEHAVSLTFYVWYPKSKIAFSTRLQKQEPVYKRVFFFSSEGKFTLAVSSLKCINVTIPSILTRHEACRANSKR